MMHSVASHPDIVHLIYWLAIFSNLGPFAIYATIILGTVNGMSLPRWGVWGARHFFVGCSQAHVIMAVMLVSMPLHAWLTMAPTWLVIGLLVWHLLSNLEQTLGGGVTMYQVSSRQIRRIEF